jgi:hypothetical protein
LIAALITAAAGLTGYNVLGQQNKPSDEDIIWPASRNFPGDH